jgi:hypothetical protein
MFGLPPQEENEPKKEAPPKHDLFNGGPPDISLGEKWYATDNPTALLPFPAMTWNVCMIGAIIMSARTTTESMETLA